MRIGRRAVLAGAAGLAAGRAVAAPRWRARDLDGYWTGASYTDLQRPKELKRLVMAPAEAAAWEAPRHALGGMPPSAAGEVGQAESEFNERGAGMLRRNGEIRSSLIVDPPDGRIPYRPEFAAAVGIGRPSLGLMEGPEQRPGNERCLASPLAGAPMIPGPDSNVLQFVHAPGVLAIVCEKYHEVRVIPLSGAPVPQRLPPSWIGESRGRWDGDTLVVETAGFRVGVTNRGAGLFVSGAARIVEWFTRTAADAIFYDVEVTDPQILTRPWRAEMTLVPSGRIFEYACHEGNYGLPDILRIARQGEER